MSAKKKDTEEEKEEKMGYLEAVGLWGESFVRRFIHSRSTYYKWKSDGIPAKEAFRMARAAQGSTPQSRKGRRRDLEAGVHRVIVQIVKLAETDPKKFRMHQEFLNTLVPDPSPEDVARLQRLISLPVLPGSGEESPPDAA